MKRNKYLKTLFATALLFAAGTMRAAVVDTLAVYSDGMKKNVQAKISGINFAIYSPQE